ARSVATLLGPMDVHSLDAIWAADTEVVDHRRLGFGTSRGVRHVGRGYRAQFEIADDITHRTDDVLALRPDAFLLHRSKSGTGRMSGGSFEQTSFLLRAFDADGRVARTEFFDDDCAEQALARFDELTTVPASSHAASRRRPAVRPNAATANSAAIDALIAARTPQARAQFIALHVGDGFEL